MVRTNRSDLAELLRLLKEAVKVTEPVQTVEKKLRRIAAPIDDCG